MRTIVTAVFIFGFLTLVLLGENVFSTGFCKDFSNEIKEVYNEIKNADVLLLQNEVPEEVNEKAIKKGNFLNIDEIIDITYIRLLGIIPEEPNIMYSSVSRKSKLLS